jgi:arsenite/tail-anchored protein-transporting ATPase
MRIVLFTGKGGVGKTTIAAATALRVAATGRKTLIMSTDPAHSVADALGEDVGPDASEVAPGLWAEQIDPQRRLEDNWRDIQQHAMAVLNWAGFRLSRGWTNCSLWPTSSNAMTKDRMTWWWLIALQPARR